MVCGKCFFFTMISVLLNIVADIAPAEGFGSDGLGFTPDWSVAVVQECDVILANRVHNRFIGAGAMDFFWCCWLPILAPFDSAEAGREAYPVPVNQHPVMRVGVLSA